MYDSTKEVELSNEIQASQSHSQRRSTTTTTTTTTLPDRMSSSSCQEDDADLNDLSPLDHEALMEQFATQDGMDQLYWNDAVQMQHHHMQQQQQHHRHLFFPEDIPNELAQPPPHDDEKVAVTTVVASAVANAVDNPLHDSKPSSAAGQGVSEPIHSCPQSNSLKISLGDRFDLAASNCVQPRTILPPQSSEGVLTRDTNDEQEDEDDDEEEEDDDDDDDDSNEDSDATHSVTASSATVAAMQQVSAQKRPSVSSINSAQKPTNKRKRIRKKYEPATVDYVEYTDDDVLCQRGGLANKHPGNIRYHKAKEKLQPLYEATPKAKKGQISKQLVDTVHQWGGRFVEKEKGNDRWYVIHHKKACIKASQALRENYTKAQRAAKRARYRNKKKQEDVVEI